MSGLRERERKKLFALMISVKVRSRVDPYPFLYARLNFCSTAIAHLNISSTFFFL